MLKKYFFLVLMLFAFFSKGNFLLAQLPTPINYGQSIEENLQLTPSSALFSSPNANPGDVLFIKVSSNGLKLNLELLDSTGLLVDSVHGTFNNHLQIIYPIPAGGASGSYKMIVSNTGIWTGEFCITLVRMNEMPDAAFLNCNSSLDVTRVCNSDIKSFRYMVTQGSNSRITIGVDPYAPEAWVCAPDGTMLKYGQNGFNNALVIDQIPAPVTGCYHVFVTDAESFWTGEVSISHTLLSGDCAAPSVQSSPSNGNVCVGSPISLSVSSPLPNATYVWSGPNGFTSTQANILFPEAADSLSGIYTVIVNAPGVCSSALTRTISVKPLPTALATVMPATGSVCAGQSFTLGVTTDAPSPSSTYQWSGPNGYMSTIKSPTISTASNLQTEVRTYFVTVTNGITGCTNTSSISIQINAKPIVNITLPQDGKVCFGQTLHLDVETNAQNYHWSGPNGFMSNLKNPNIPNVNNLNGGTYTVTVTDLATGCSSTSSKFIAVNSLPTASISGGTLPLCAGASTNLTGCCSAQTYLWSTGETTGVITVTPLLTTKYFLTITNSNGCIGSDSTVVTVNPLPTISTSAPPDLEICFGEDPILLCAMSSNANNPVWKWTKNGSFFSNNQCISLLNPGQSGIFVASVTDGITNCTNAASPIPINIYQTPTVSISQITPPPYFEGDDITLCANSNASNPSYEWAGPNGFVGTALCTLVNNATILASGTYYVTVTDEHGCEGYDEVIIDITVGIVEPMEEWGLKVAPNPTTGIVQIQTQKPFSGKLELVLFAENGRRIRDYWMETTELTLDLTDLPVGTYVLRISDNESLGVFRLVVIR